MPTDLVVTVRDSGGAPVVGQEVFVVVSNGESVTDQLTSTTSEDGEARFDGVGVGAGYTARAVTVAEGLPYQGERTPLVPGVAADLQLVVGGIAETPVDLHIDVLHIILTIVEPGFYQGLQIMSVRNVGEQAAFGRETFNGEPVGIIIPLPTGASGVSTLPADVGGLDPARLAQDGNRLLDLRPLPPGNRQVAVQYELLVGENTGEVAITVPHPTAQVSLLLGPGPERVVLESDRLQSLGPMNIEGQGDYANYRADALPAGDTLRFRLSTAGAPLSIASWALLGLAVALLASAAASIFLTGPRPVDPGRRQELIAEIARLDRQHDAGLLTAPDHHARRAEALDRLMEIDGGTGAWEAEAGDAGRDAGGG